MTAPVLVVVGLVIFLTLRSIAWQLHGIKDHAKSIREALWEIERTLRSHEK